MDGNNDVKESEASPAVSSLSPTAIHQSSKEYEAYTCKNGDRLEGFFCFAADQPGDISYFQLHDMQETVGAIQDEIPEEETLVPLPPTEAQIGQPCLVQDVDEVYYRAVISNRTGDDVDVLFVDYGTSRQLSVALVKRIPENLLKYPMQVIPVVLTAEQTAKIDIDCDNYVLAVKDYVTTKGWQVFFDGEEQPSEVTPKEVEVEVCTEPLNGVEDCSETSSTEIDTYVCRPELMPGQVKVLEAEGVVLISEKQQDLVYFRSIEDAHALCKMTEQLSSISKQGTADWRFTNLPSHMLCEGAACLVFDDHEWYRGKIVSIESVAKTASVCLVDFGDRCITASFANLRRLPSRLRITPPLCLPCHPRDTDSWAVVRNRECVVMRRVGVDSSLGVAIASFLTNANRNYSVEELLEIGNRVKANNGVDGGPLPRSPHPPADECTDLMTGSVDVVVTDVAESGHLQVCFCKKQDCEEPTEWECRESREFRERLNFTYHFFAGIITTVDSPHINAVYVVLNGHGQYGRARVLSKSSDSETYVLNFIDYGFTRSFASPKFYWMLPHLFYEPPYSWLIALDDILPEHALKHSLSRKQCGLVHSTLQGIVLSLKLHPDQPLNEPWWTPRLASVSCPASHVAEALQKVRNLMKPSPTLPLDDAIDATLESALAHIPPRKINRHQIMEVRVTNIESPSAFWCREIATERSIEKIQTSLLASLGPVQECSTAPLYSTKEVVIGAFYALPCTWGWRRIRVLDNPLVDLVKVQCVDDGLKAEAHPNDLRMISADSAAAQIPCLALRCSLHGVLPPEGGSQWTDCTCQRFEEIAKGATWTATVQRPVRSLTFNTAESVLHVSMVDKEEPHQSLADMLISEDFAVAATSSISSESALSPLPSAENDKAPTFPQTSQVLCSVDGVTTVLPYPDQPSLNTEGEIEALLTHVTSAHDFWITPLSHLHEVSCSDAEPPSVLSLASQGTNPVLDLPIWGAVLLEQSWTRVLINSVVQENVRCWQKVFVDVGRSEVVIEENFKLNDIHEMPQPRWWRLPRLAFRCSLVSLPGDSDHEEIERFLLKSFVDKTPVHLSLLGYNDDGVHAVKIVERLEVAEQRDLKTCESGTVDNTDDAAKNTDEQQDTRVSAETKVINGSIETAVVNEREEKETVALNHIEKNQTTLRIADDSESGTTALSNDEATAAVKASERKEVDQIEEKEITSYQFAESTTIGKIAEKEPATLDKATPISNVIEEKVSTTVNEITEKEASVVSDMIDIAAEENAPAVKDEIEEEKANLVKTTNNATAAIDEIESKTSAAFNDIEEKTLVTVNLTEEKETAVFNEIKTEEKASITIENAEKETISVNIEEEASATANEIEVNKTATTKEEPSAVVDTEENALITAAENKEKVIISADAKFKDQIQEKDSADSIDEIERKASTPGYEMQEKAAATYDDIEEKEVAINDEIEEKPSAILDDEEKPSAILDAEEKASSVLDAEEKASSVVDTEEKASSVVDVEEKASSVVDTEEKASSVIDAEEKASSVVDTEEKASSVVDTEEKASSVVDAEEKASSVVDTEEKASSVVDVEEKASSAVDVEEKASSVVDTQEKASSVVDTEEKASSVVDTEEKAPSVVDAEEKAPSVVDAEEKASSVVDTEEKASSVVGTEEKASSVVDTEEKASSVVDVEEKASSVVDTEEKASSVVDAEEKASSVVDVEEKASSVVDVEEKASSVVDTEEKASSVVDAEDKASPVVDTEEKASSVVDAEEKASSVVDVEEKASFVVDTEEKASSVVDIEEKASSVVDVKEKASPVVDTEVKASSVVDVEEKASSVVDTEEKASTTADEVEERKTVSVGEVSTFVGETERETLITVDENEKRTTLVDDIEWKASNAAEKIEKETDTVGYSTEKDSAFVDEGEIRKNLDVNSPEAFLVVAENKLKFISEPPMIGDPFSCQTNVISTTVETKEKEDIRESCERNVPKQATQFILSANSHEEFLSNCGKADNAKMDSGDFIRLCKLDENVLRDGSEQSLKIEEVSNSLQHTVSSRVLQELEVVENLSPESLDNLSLSSGSKTSSASAVTDLADYLFKTLADAFTVEKPKDEEVTILKSVSHCDEMSPFETNENSASGNPFVFSGTDLDGKMMRLSLAFVHSKDSCCMEERFFALCDRATNQLRFVFLNSTGPCKRGLLYVGTASDVQDSINYKLVAEGVAELALSK